MSVKISVTPVRDSATPYPENAEVTFALGAKGNVLITLHVPALYGERIRSITIKREDFDMIRKLYSKE